MSGILCEPRSTADIVVDLSDASERFVKTAPHSTLLREVADRLTELDNDCRMYLRVIADYEQASNRFDVLRPLCPSCNGTCWVPIGVREKGMGCPDCTDGKMPFERMAAIVNAVFDLGGLTVMPKGHGVHYVIEATRVALRNVKP